jgi:hypothetical protein
MRPYLFVFLALLTILAMTCAHAAGDDQDEDASDDERDLSDITEDSPSNEWKPEQNVQQCGTFENGVHTDNADPDYQSDAHS